MRGGYQYAVFSQHGERRKGEVRLLSAGGDEVIRSQFAARLFLNRSEDIRYQNPVFVARGPRISAQVGHRLKMNSFDRRHPLFGELNDISYLGVVDVPDQRRDQNNSDFQLLAALDRPQFGLQQGRPADGAIDTVCDAVELQEEIGDARILQRVPKIRIPRQTEAAL